VNWLSGNNFPSTYTITALGLTADGGDLEERSLHVTHTLPVLDSNFALNTPASASLSRTMASSRTEGRRQEELTKERQRMREQYEKQKAALVEETEKARPSSNRFVGQHDSMEDSLKRSTVGLVRLEEFQARRKEIQEAKEREAAMTSELKYAFLT
jgi:arginine/lysine/ornithine decarboxylase